MALERLELLIPLPLLLVKPGLEPTQPLRAESEHAQSSVIRTPLVGDHARLEKDAKMSAHGGRGEACCLGQLSGPQRPAAEDLDHLAASRVR
jgi:hypothetical protein